MHVGEGRPLEETYCRRVVDGELPNLVRDTRREERTRDLPITTESGIGAYIGVPITLPGGESYGMLCCLSPRAEPALGAGEVGLLRIVAGMLGEELDREQRDGQTRQRQRESIVEGPRGRRASPIVLQPIVELATGPGGGRRGSEPLRRRAAPLTRSLVRRGGGRGARARSSSWRPSEPP